MEQLFSSIVQYIDTWGYLAIIAGMALESACLPVPSELIFGFAGYLVFLGKLDFTTTVIAGVAGGLIGSVFAYLVGYHGGLSFIEKYGKYLFLSKRHVTLAQNWFDRYGLKATFFSRLLPIVRTFISLPAGFAKVDFSKFVIYTVLGSVPWTIGLIYAGMILGENWRKVNTIGHNASMIVGVVLIVISLYYIKRNREQGSPN